MGRSSILFALMKPFRHHHLLQILESYDAQRAPMDFFLRNYFRENKAIGSKDRAFIAETIYGMIRWKGLLDFLCGEKVTWEQKFELFKSERFAQAQQNPELPDHIRVSFPLPLFEAIVRSYGLERGMEICRICNGGAPLAVRVNTLKTTRDALLSRWKERYAVGPSQVASHGIIFQKRENFFAFPEFAEGLFEVQDEGSQLIAALVDPKPGQLVFDFCSGSGGKALAFAPQMEGKGQIYLHDIRKTALLEARKRLKRAGIQNAQGVDPTDEKKLKKLKKKMDWVLVDAPCSGTGTLRRNPDMKWKYTDEMLTRLVGQQRTIFEKALSYLHPDGQIVYATCSLLKEENEEQVAHFLKTYALTLVREFKSTLVEGGMDAFYGAVLKKG